MGNLYEVVTGKFFKQHHDGRNRGRTIGGLVTGASMDSADTELFMKLSRVIHPKRIFIVGNAWGYSTIILSTIFNRSAVDVIDPGLFGDTLLGMELTRKVAAFAGRDVFVFRGSSPNDTSLAVREVGKAYMLAFIDG